MAKVNTLFFVLLLTFAFVLFVSAFPGITGTLSRHRREMEAVYERNTSCTGRSAEVDRPINLRQPVANKGCKCIEDGWMRCIRKKQVYNADSYTSRPWVLAEDDWRH